MQNNDADDDILCRGVAQNSHKAKKKNKNK